MMYAQHYSAAARFRPTSLIAAVAINGGVIAALMFAAPEVITKLRPPVIVFTPTPEYTPPPDPRPSPDLRKPTDRPTTAPTPGPTAAATPTVGPDLGLDARDGRGIGDPGPGPGTIPGPSETIAPTVIGASLDPRYARDQEPPYPDNLRDAGVEGVVKLRLTIGADGRVKQAVPLGGNPQLVRIAVRHVLAKWRFRPATRGAVPEESTQVMTVRFRLDS